MAISTVIFSAIGLVVEAISDQAVAQVSGGYGGWNIISRPRRVGLTQWNGKDPMRVQVPILFDGYARGEGQEINISKLGRMSGPPIGARGEPPVVKVSGNAIPDIGIEAWVIENLVWGTNVIWARDNNGTMSRMRQDCVVNLLQHVDEDRVAFAGLATQPVGSSPSTLAFYRVQEGDNLNQIAAGVYGDSRAWTKIAEANDLRDPNALIPGEDLVIP